MSGPREQTTEPARDKIAAVISEHGQAHPFHWPPTCLCGWVNDSLGDQTTHSEHVADTVVEQLGLTEERSAYANIVDPGRLKQPLSRRWVSGWSVVGGEQ